MIAGLEELSAGEIYFDERLMNRVAPQHRNVAMVFETYALYPTLTVYENLAFPLRAAGRPDGEIKQRVSDIVEILQCEDLLHLKPSSLSSGQSQLVGLGRALMRQPNVFIMDEPISHLDTRLRSRMRSHIKRLHIDLGYSMLYVTHDQEEAMALADRIAIMDVGKIVQIGSPQDVFHHPFSMYVAGFVGEPPMNFLECRAEQHEGRYQLSYGSYAVPLPADMAAIAHAQPIPRDVVVGIRPFYIKTACERSEQHTIPTTVFVVEPMGDGTIISADTEDTRMQIVVDPETVAKSGDVLWLALEPKHILLFDKQTGKRLVG
jgi:multiple sugar transport system ATP-binding protein